MAEDLAEVKERLEQLEVHVGTQGAENTQPGEGPLELEGADYLLRSIRSKQSMHNSDLRYAMKGQERLQSSVDSVISKLNSGEETLSAIDRGARGLAELLEARQQSS